MQVDTVLCPNCHSNILQKCQMIHERACFKSMEKQKEQKGFLFKMFSEPKRQKMQEQDMIPCTECGESVPFCIFAIHQEQCVGNQLTKCHQCQISFPTFLFEQHLQVCTGPKYQPPANNNLLNNIKPPEPKMNIQPQKNIGFKMPQLFKPFAEKVEIMIPIDSDSEDEELLEMIATLAKSEIINHKLTEDPLTGQQLKKLQVIKLNSVEECSICCCEMNKKANHIRLNCTHTFHKKCIASWLGKNPFCPMCRQHALKQ